MNSLFSALSSLGQFAEQRFNQYFRPSLFGFNTMWAPGANNTPTVFGAQTMTAIPKSQSAQVLNFPNGTPQNQQPVDINAGFQSGGLVPGAGSTTGLVGQNGQDIQPPKTEGIGPIYGPLRPTGPLQTEGPKSQLPVTSPKFEPFSIQAPQAQAAPSVAQPSFTSEATPFNPGFGGFTGLPSLLLGGNSLLANLLNALGYGSGSGGGGAGGIGETPASKKKKRQPNLEQIANYENRGVPPEERYKSVGVSGDLGKYQVSPPTLQTYAPMLLGRDVSPEEFLSNPQLQEQFAQGLLGHMADLGMDPEQAIKAWHVGINGSNSQDPTVMKRANDYLQGVVGR